MVTRSLELYKMYIYGYFEEGLTRQELARPNNGCTTFPRNLNRTSYMRKYIDFWSDDSCPKVDSEV